jgi:hypothetical protein
MRPMPRVLAPNRNWPCRPRGASHPLVPGHIPIYGYYYDVKSGRLVEVPEATAAGKAMA